MTFEEYVKYYEKTGKLLLDNIIRKNKLNETQLKSKYKKYLSKIEKKDIKTDDKWKELKSKLDLTHCKLEERLINEKMFDEVKELRQNAGWLMNTIDPAHVLPKGGYPKLKYDIENVVPLNRFSHSCLDSMRDPISGDQISKEAHDLFWKFIIGNDLFEELNKRKLK